MISTNYKKNKLLKDFIINKLTQSKNLNKKHNKYITINKTISLLSIVNACFAVAYPFLNTFLFHDYSVISYTLPPFISFCLAGGFVLLDGKIMDKHHSLQIEYTHEDFLQLSKILTEEEMNKFAEEIEKSNSLYEWTKYIEVIDQKEKNMSIEMKKENRKSYISSLYKTGELK